MTDFGLDNAAIAALLSKRLKRSQILERVGDRLVRLVLMHGHPGKLPLLDVGRIGIVE